MVPEVLYLTGRALAPVTSSSAQVKSLAKKKHLWEGFLNARKVDDDFL